MKKKIIIETLRLRLRPIDNKDAVDLFKYRSDAVTNKFQGWIPKKLEDAYEFIKKTSTEMDIVNSWFQFVLMEKKSNKLIGDIGVHFLDIDKKQAEIGITLHKNHQGKGFATEALKGIMDYLFNQLNKHRIIASIDPENNKSIELFERLGFRKEAHFRKNLLVNGKWADDLIYAILKNEWK